MKKSTLSIVILLAVVIIGVWYLGFMKKVPTGTDSNTGTTTAMGSSTLPVSVMETTKISSKLSKYENAELGFSVNYPTTWEMTNTNTGASFVIPLDQNQVSTVAKLQADINVYSAKCAFPPVTTIKERGTVATDGKLSANMISMSNTVQGRSYFNRMYSLQQGGICYMFSFSSIAFSPESRGLKGSNITQAQNNNKAIINTADSDFTSMFKSFALVQGPSGQDETKVAPVKR
jgi:hypothetical protein